MPIYEYTCTACKRHHEIMQRITEEPLTSCPTCGGTLKKMISNTSFVLKGTGWYATDYASPGGKKTCGSDDAKTNKPSSEPKVSGNKETGAAKAKTGDTVGSK